MRDAEIIAGLLPDHAADVRAALDAYRGSSAGPVPWEPVHGAGTEEDPYSMPFPRYPSEVHGLTEALVAAGAMPVFDWTTWQGALRTVDDVRRAPLADVLRTVTVLVRGERFSDGTIAAAADSGVLAALAERVLAALEAPAPRG